VVGASGCSSGSTQDAPYSSTSIPTNSVLSGFGAL